MVGDLPYSALHAPCPASLSELADSMEVARFIIICASTSAPVHKIGEQYEGDAAFYGAPLEVNYFGRDPVSRRSTLNRREITMQ